VTENWKTTGAEAINPLFFDELPAANNNTDTVSSAAALKGKDKGKVTTAASDSLAIPDSPEDFMRSDAKIANALFGNGELFKNKLNNLPKSKQAFDELTRRFPNSEYDAKAHYYQYLIFLDKNLQGLAEKEKQYILQNYPLSDVSEVLRNQGKKSSQETEGETSARLYASTYQLFLDGDYNQVIKNKFIAKTKYPSSFEMPQFEFLEAVSYGKTKQYDAYKRSLSDIITKYKEGEIKQNAQEYLIAYIQFESHLKDTTAPFIKPEIIQLPKDTISEKFVFDTTNVFVLLQLKEKYINVQSVVAKLVKFNKTKFDIFRIKVNPFFMDGFTLLQMKKFDGITDARNYYDALQIHAPSLVGDNDLNKVDYFIIAPANFRLIKNQVDLDRYSRYYIENYLK
jgi:outer membrane protein assembly factor BamD (BamD/ComL family)